MANQATNSPRTETHWSAIKVYLRELGTDGLIDLIHDLYRSSPDVRLGLQARFFPTEDLINGIRKRIILQVYPDPLGSRRIQVREALNMIRKFHGISGDTHSATAMLLDGIEAGTAQARDLGVEDDAYFNGLSAMMKMLVSLMHELSRPTRRVIGNRLKRIYENGKDVGWGHSDELRKTLKEVRNAC